MYGRDFGGSKGQYSLRIFGLSTHLILGNESISEVCLYKFFGGRPIPSSSARCTISHARCIPLSKISHLLFSASSSSIALNIDGPLGDGAVPRPLDASYQDELYRASFQLLGNLFLNPVGRD